MAEENKSQKTEDELKGTIEVETLIELISQYQRSRTLEMKSPNTVKTNESFFKTFIWFLQDRRYTVCGEEQLLQFFYYLNNGHTEPRGRWGQSRYRNPIRPVTYKDYYIALRSLFKWLVIKDFLSASPFEAESTGKPAAITKPKFPEEIKHPLTEEQVLKLIEAAGKTTSPLRDVAIVSFLLDTGCRVSELISIRLGEVDLEHGRVRVLGKGNKQRNLYFHPDTAQRLRLYLKATGRQFENAADADSALFLSFQKGRLPAALTRNAVGLLLKRLAKRARIRQSCSPHAFRRTYAVWSLKNGTHTFAIQEALGHTDLEMTKRYCRIAQADVQEQHRRFGPLTKFEFPASVSVSESSANDNSGTENSGTENSG